MKTSKIKQLTIFFMNDLLSSGQTIRVTPMPGRAFLIKKHTKNIFYRSKYSCSYIWRWLAELNSVAILAYWLLWTIKTIFKCDNDNLIHLGALNKGGKW